MKLHITHRPESFSKVIGNKDILPSLKNIIKDEDRPHSYLFHGPSGCGKTTLARIVASEIGCTGVDLQEINSADYRGIDTIRALLNNVYLQPLEGDYRVWILDEVHKLTNDAQNALLKILEDTPEHVYFMLCTTNPEKLISAIKGRCSQYGVNALTEKEMMKLLMIVVKAEDDSLEKKIYLQIIENSQGKPRDALQILSQVLSVDPEERLSLAKKAATLDVQVKELCTALIKKYPWKKTANILKRLKEQGEEPEKIRYAVLGYCQAIFLNGKKDNQVAYIMDEFRESFWNSGFPGLTIACYTVVVDAG